ncbi:MAG: ABC transporter ATP-binding protein [Candidatus Bathyarchaeia archaeon]
MPKENVLLSVQDLVVDFHTLDGVVHALDGVTFDIRKREILGLVGETGCGKSATGLAILKILPDNSKIVKGQVMLEGDEILHKAENQVLNIRGRKIAMIFQDPASSLNPVFPIGEQLLDVLKIHNKATDEDSLRKLAHEKLIMVELSDPESVMALYPHELSGGMQQRVMMAIALSSSPLLLIADEPTTALDVTIQAQLLVLLKKLKETLGLSVLLITHNLGVVRELCDRIAIMYAGSIVESAKTDRIFKNPLHPYTRGLISSVVTGRLRGKVLNYIPGTVPSLLHPPLGCRFHPRCSYAIETCKQSRPELLEVEDEHFVACYNMPKEPWWRT